MFQRYYQWRVASVLAKINGLEGLCRDIRSQLPDERFRQGAENYHPSAEDEALCEFHRYLFQKVIRLKEKYDYFNSKVMSASVAETPR